MRHPTAPVSIGISFALAIGLVVTSFFALPAFSTEPDRTLKLFFGHTGERGEFTFKKNGRYDSAQLAKINHFLRDWRRNEETHMDPHLLDLVWSIYQKTGSHDYIHIVSAYRSPTTNEMLRRRTNGVAKNSQHRLGKAMDWFVTDVPLAKLRGIAMQMQGGGVGYYPRSGSPFVHTDTGNVRAWPRMSREQLLALFPNGNTLHLPADGKPLPGYEQAVARRQAQSGTALAYLEDDSSEDTSDGSSSSDTKSWLQHVFPNKTNAETASAAPAAEPAQAPSPTAVAVATADNTVDPRVPRARPPSETETAADDQMQPTLVASADADALGMLVMPALGPKAVAGDADAQPPMTASPAADAIETLVVPADAAATAAAPVELAYASPAEAPVELDHTSRAAPPVEVAHAAPAAPAAEPARAAPTAPPVEAAHATSATPPVELAPVTPAAAPVALARATPAAAPAPTPAPDVDRTILAAFDVVDHSKAVGQPDPALIVALTLRSSGVHKPAEQVRSASLAVAAARPAHRAVEGTRPLVIETGVVMAAADLSGYVTDEVTLRGLIDTASPADPDVGQLAMPKPAKSPDLFKAPEPSQVADLRGSSGPPVDHFARTEKPQGDQGFFTKLFASLIE